MISSKPFAGAAIAAALILGACHKAEPTTTNEVNAAADASNIADTNANDEMINEDAGSAAVANAE